MRYYGIAVRSRRHPDVAGGDAGGGPYYIGPRYFRISLGAQKPPHPPLPIVTPIATSRRELSIAFPEIRTAVSHQADPA